MVHDEPSIIDVAIEAKVAPAEAKEILDDSAHRHGCVLRLH